MSSVKWALIIASPFGGLCSPINDANAMATVLRKQNFEIYKYNSTSATHDGILNAWEYLISASASEDTFIIFYSGHGGLVQAPTEDKIKYEGLGLPQYQFIVPVNYGQTSYKDFRGILDLEISYMLLDTTDKTRNVTIILDCCHAGKMFRYPGHNVEACAKNLPNVNSHGIASYLARLQQEGHFYGKLYMTGNPHAVRIAAAATTENHISLLAGILL